VGRPSAPLPLDPTASTTPQMLARDVLAADPSSAQDVARQRTVAPLGLVAVFATGGASAPGVPKPARDEAASRKLWEVSEALTSVQWLAKA